MGIPNHLLMIGSEDMVTSSDQVGTVSYSLWFKVAVYLHVESSRFMGLGLGSLDISISCVVLSEKTVMHCHEIPHEQESFGALLKNGRLFML